MKIRNRLIASDILTGTFGELLKSSLRAACQSERYDGFRRLLNSPPLTPEYASAVQQNRGSRAGHDSTSCNRCTQNDSMCRQGTRPPLQNEICWQSGLARVPTASGSLAAAFDRVLLTATQWSCLQHSFREFKTLGLRDIHLSPASASNQPTPARLREHARTQTQQRSQIARRPSAPSVLGFQICQVTSRQKGRPHTAFDIFVQGLKP